MRPIETYLKEIERALSGSEVDIPMDIKLRVAELILLARKRRQKKRFGLFIILGWERTWNASTDVSDAEQDLFAEAELNVMRLPDAPTDGSPSIGSTLDFDGAILINDRGDILHSGVMIEGLRPRQVAEKVNPGKYPDLSSQFGFKGKVHTRHLSAIAASYVFQPTTVFTMSEETGDLHVFENGRIAYTLSESRLKGAYRAFRHAIRKVRRLPSMLKARRSDI
jgi:DNA integrity scanning protein DisA with diadenylate cyclase activity